LPGPSTGQAFYACINLARATYVSVPAIKALAKAAFLEAADECDGFEMRISLFSMTRTLLENEQRSKLQWADVSTLEWARRADTVLEAVLSARDEAERERQTPMHVRLGYSRTFESEAHYRALTPVVRARARELSGLDVLGIVSGGDREPMPPALRSIIEAVRVDVGDLTVHAGEFEGHASVDHTLELKPQAIGHGVRSVESPKTLRALRERGVTLEVCPHSNFLLIHDELAALTAAHGQHPVVTLQRAQVHTVLGSDDPTPMGTTFTHEWRRALDLGADSAQLEADMQRRWAQLGPRAYSRTAVPET
jgi:adenosine deaminase